LPGARRAFVEGRLTPRTGRRKSAGRVSPGALNLSAL